MDVNCKIISNSVCLKIFMTICWRKTKKEWMDGEDGIDSRDNINENGEKIVTVVWI